MIINLENEVWSNIPNSTYAVSTYARVKRIPFWRVHNINKISYLTKERLLKPNNCNTKKYWRILIKYLDDKSIHESVHRLVAKAFVPNPDILPQVNHIDGNRNNNYYLNLEWITNLENTRHAFKIGLRVNSFINMQGEKCHLNKYSESIITQIPSFINSGLNYAQTAKKLGIPITLITEIKAGRTWKHLKLVIPDSPWGLCRTKKKPNKN